MIIRHLLGYRDIIGGMIPSVVCLAKEQRRRGHDPSLVMHKNFVGDAIDGIPIERDPHLTGDEESHAQMLLKSLQFAICNKPRNQSVILHGHSRGGALACALSSALRGQPSVVTAHCYGRQRGLYRAIARCRRLRFVCLTRHMSDYYGLPYDSLRVISECVEVRSHKSRKLGGKRPSFVGLGALIPRKRWHIAIEAIARLRDENGISVRFDVFGPRIPHEEGVRYADRLEKLIREYALADSVRLAGVTQDVSAALQQADALLHPAYMEPCSVAVLEAISVGTPVLAADSGGNRELVQPPLGGTCYEVDSAGAMRSAMVSFLEATSRTRLPAECVGRLLKQRTPEAVASCYEGVYRLLCL